MRLAKPSVSNTPCRANVFRFMRVVCHAAFFAISTQSFWESGRADSNMNGRSGTFSASPAFELLELHHQLRQGIRIIRAADHVAVECLALGSDRLRMHHFHDVRKRPTLAGT